MKLAMASRGFVSVSHRATVVTIVLRRPSALNAASLNLLEELSAALDGLRIAPTRVLILTGAAPAFCAGIDLAESRGATSDFIRRRVTTMYRVLAQVRALQIPVIAAIDGVCLGFGLELAISCDIRIASPTSRFGYPEVRVAVPAPTALVIEAIGTARAQELVLTGRTLRALEALDIGLVHRLVDDVEKAAAGEADLLARLPRMALEQTKENSRIARTSGKEAAIAHHVGAVVEATHTPDRREALEAFGAKRLAKFRR